MNSWCVLADTMDATLIAPLIAVFGGDGNTPASWDALRSYLAAPQGRAVCGALLLASGLWGLQPGTRRGRRFWGSVACLVGLGCLVSLLWPLPWEPTAIAFRGAAALVLVSSVAMISARNPVYSAVWFALTLIGTASLMMLLNAQFVALATVAVYAGAIVVTFLFVLMLAQSSGRAPYDRVASGPLPSWLAAPISVLLFATLVVGLHHWGTGTRAEYIAQVRNELSSDAMRPELDPDTIQGVHWTYGQHAQPVVIIQLMRQANSKGTNRAELAQKIESHLVSRLQMANLTVRVGEVDLFDTNHVARLGGQLFTRFLLPVLGIAALLLAALVGAIAIASFGPSMAPVRRSP